MVEKATREKQPRKKGLRRSYKEKEALVKVMQKQRSNARCQMVSKLILERNTLTKDINAEIAIATETLGALRFKMETMVEEAKLSAFSGVCGNDLLHATLKEFDARTLEMEAAILETE